MPSYVFAGPQEIVLPHQRALEGATGTLVLTPGEPYDFGLDAAGQEVRPIGPAWWWKPQPPPPEDPPADDPPAVMPEVSGTFSDTFGEPGPQGTPDPEGAEPPADPPAEG